MQPVNLPINPGDAAALGPFLAIVAAALAALMIDMAYDDEEPKERLILAIGVLGAGFAAATSTMWNWEHPGRVILGGSLYADPFTSFFDLLFAVLMGGTLLVSWRGFARARIRAAEFCCLAFLSFAGMFLMNRAGDTLTLFLALELMSMPVYVLAGLAVGTKTGREAALKYFVLGSLASAIMLFGMALLYGYCGTLTYEGLNDYLIEMGKENPLFLAGVAFVLAGLAFKIAAVPFHMWTPDVYEGAPTAVTTMMATGVKAAGSAALLRFLGGAVFPAQSHWIGMVWWLAALSMIVGNLGALRQQSVKRLFAYSSIAHAGYLLLGFLGDDRGLPAVANYAFIYALTTLGAFGVLQWFDDNGRELAVVDDFRGVGRQYPSLAIAMTIFMLSFAGIPPAAGFAAKFFVFGAAVQSGHYLLALLGIMTSLLGVYYYFRIVIAMWMAEPERPFGPLGAPPAALFLMFLAAAIVILGIFPGWLWSLASVSTATLVS